MLHQNTSHSQRVMRNLVSMVKIEITYNSVFLLINKLFHNYALFA